MMKKKNPALLLCGSVCLCIFRQTYGTWCSNCSAGCRLPVGTGDLLDFPHMWKGGREEGEWRGRAMVVRRTPAALC